jgi:hypothetical protein
VGANLVLPKLLEFPLRLANRSPQIFGSGVRFADHLAAFTGRCFQPVEFAHGSLLASRLTGVVFSLGRSSV